MIFAIFSKKDEQLLSISFSLLQTVDSVYGSIGTIGIFASRPYFVTNSLSQIEILMAGDILKTGEDSEMFMIDQAVDIRDLETVQIFDSMRLLGSDVTIRPRSVIRKVSNL